MGMINRYTKTKPEKREKFKSIIIERYGVYYTKEETEDHINMLGGDRWRKLSRHYKFIMRIRERTKRS